MNQLEAERAFAKDFQCRNGRLPDYEDYMAYLDEFEQRHPPTDSREHRLGKMLSGVMAAAFVLALLALVILWAHPASGQQATAFVGVTTYQPALDDIREVLAYSDETDRALLLGLRVPLKGRSGQWSELTWSRYEGRDRRGIFDLQLDVISAKQPMVKIYPVKNGDVPTMVSALQQIFAATPGRTSTARGRGFR